MVSTMLEILGLPCTTPGTGGTTSGDFDCCDPANTMLCGLMGLSICHALGEQLKEPQKLRLMVWIALTQLKSPFGKCLECLALLLEQESPHGLEPIRSGLSIDLAIRF